VVCALVLSARVPAVAAEPAAATDAFRLLTLAEAEQVKKGPMLAEARARHPDQNWPAAKPEAIEAWKDLRFGLMIDWGPVSITEKEHSWSRDNPTPAAEYDALPLRFNPVRFDAKEWMALAKRAGIRYVVPIAKHHDGFCLWPSRFTGYGMQMTPFQRDIIGELASACREQGLRFGIYFSMPDWHHPAFAWTGKNGLGLRDRYDWDVFEQFTHDQLRELMTAYGPLVTLWFDKPDQYLGRGAALIRMARELQPDILVNNRSGNGGDYRTPEQNIGSFDNSRPWESCMTVSAHHQWSWGGKRDGVKSPETCLRMLISVVGGGGNMLLNVGPTPDGEIAPEQRAILEYLGAWLSRHGESIYATRGGPYRTSQELASTHRGSTVYLHVLRWPDETLVLPALGRRVVASSLLTGGDVRVEQDATSLRITVPIAHRQPVDTIVTLQLDGPASDIAPIAFGTPPSKKPWPEDWESGLTPVNVTGAAVNVGDQMEKDEKAGH